MERTSRASEDYLECILILSGESEKVHRVDVARRMKVSQPAIQKAIHVLEDEGYVECEGMHIYLTPKGQEYASYVYNRHCIIREFLLTHGIDFEDADADACACEHILSDATFNMMKDYVDALHGHKKE